VLVVVVVVVRTTRPTKLAGLHVVSKFKETAAPVRVLKRDR
jgi:hypothetical protein